LLLYVNRRFFYCRPITKDLFVSSVNSGQYASVQCRVAINAFNKLIKDWCDFTLLENHTYVKFLRKYVILFLLYDLVLSYLSLFKTLLFTVFCFSLARKLLD